MGRSWRVDGTYIRVRSQWVYLYRAVDKSGQTVDFRLSSRRDVVAAKAFFWKAISHEGSTAAHGYPRRLCRLASCRTRDAHGWAAVKTYKAIEQDHRGIKSRTRPMLGFKNFDCAAITIAGIELLRRIHKGQLALGRLRLKDQAAPALWKAVMAAE